MFCKKGFLRKFAKFTGKHLRQSLFFNKVAGLRPATLLKKRFWRTCFPMNSAKFLRTPFLIEHLRWLLLMNVVSFNTKTHYQALQLSLTMFKTISNRLKVNDSLAFKNLILSQSIWHYPIMFFLPAKSP